MCDMVLSIKVICSLEPIFFAIRNFENTSAFVLILLFYLMIILLWHLKKLTNEVYICQNLQISKLQICQQNTKIQCKLAKNLICCSFLSCALSPQAEFNLPLIASCRPLNWIREPLFGEPGGSFVILCTVDYLLPSTLKATEGSGMS